MKIIHFYVIFYLQTTLVNSCDAVQWTSQNTKAKQLRIYPFVDDVMWVNRQKDLSAEKMEGQKDKVGKEKS